jgi:hypothetical protein
VLPLCREQGLSQEQQSESTQTSLLLHATGSTGAMNCCVTSMCNMASTSELQPYYTCKGKLGKATVQITCRTDKSRSSSPGMVKIFLSTMSSRPVLGSTQPPIQLVPRALSPAVKRPGHEADHLPPISAEVKKMWIYTFTPTYAFMA